MNGWTRQVQRGTRRFPCALEASARLKSGQTCSAEDTWHGLFSGLSESFYHQRSLRILKEGMNLISGHRLVLTNRLHGHILSTLMGIPNILMPNAYHKNEAFFQNWMNGISICRYAASPDQVDLAFHQLQG